MKKFKRKKFDFEVPEEIEELINQLEYNVLNDKLFDIQLDMIRMAVHGHQEIDITEEQGEEIIDYYYRRKWR